MSKYLQYCETCANEEPPRGYKGVWGYKTWLYDDAKTCEKGHPIITLNITTDDFHIIEKISKDKNFIKSMIDLHDKDIIEYELKMSQFRNQVEQQKHISNQRQQANNQNQVICPTCGSNNVGRISTSAKIGGAMMFGLLSKTAKSQFKCKNCGYKW